MVINDSSPLRTILDATALANGMFTLSNSPNGNEETYPKRLMKVSSN
jgi:hypothetical protein